MRDDPVKLIQDIVDKIFRDYNDEIAAAAEKRDASIRELQEMFELAKKSHSISNTRTGNTRIATTARITGIRTKPGFAQIVRDIIEETDGSFDKNYIEKQIEMKNPTLAERLRERTVYTILRRLQTNNDIVEVEKGMGRKASKYRKSTDERTVFPKQNGEKEV